MIINHIIPLGQDPRLVKMKGYVSTVLAFGGGKIYIGDIVRGKREIEWVQYESKDYTDRSET